MNPEPLLPARLLEFAWAVIPYWWLLVPGALFAIEPMLEGFLPPKANEKVSYWWPKERRHQYFRVAAVVALLVSSFLAWDNLNLQYNKQHGALNTAISERDDARNQRDRNVSPAINRLSGDLVGARAQIDAQAKQIEEQQKQIASQANEISALKPKPARHLDDNDKANLNLIFTPAKDEFPNVQISAPSGEPYGYAKELADEFNALGIKVPRVGLVFVTSANAAPLQVAVKDLQKVPPKAERFAQLLVAAGFKVVGGTMDTLNDSDFVLIVGPQ